MDAGKAGPRTTQRSNRGRVCAGHHGAEVRPDPERRKPPCDTGPVAWAGPSSPSGNSGLP